MPHRCAATTAKGAPCRAVVFSDLRCPLHAYKPPRAAEPLSSEGIFCAEHKPDLQPAHKTPLHREQPWLWPPSRLDPPMPPAGDPMTERKTLTNGPAHVGVEGDRAVCTWCRQPVPLDAPMYASYALVHVDAAVGVQDPEFLDPYTHASLLVEFAYSPSTCSGCSAALAPGDQVLVKRREGRRADEPGALALFCDACAKAQVDAFREIAKLHIVPTP